MTTATIDSDPESEQSIPEYIVTLPLLPDRALNTFHSKNHYVRHQLKVTLVTETAHSNVVLKMPVNVGPAATTKKGRGAKPARASARPSTLRNLALVRLEAYGWPGNVRQLINIAERAVLQARRGSGTIASLLMSDHEEMQPVMTTEGKPLKEYVEAFERMLIDNTMRRHRGSIASVMDELCLPRRTLNEKMAKYGLQRSDYL